MIGVFDSGSGGLTVLRAIRNELPSCDVVYFGDIAHAPYGQRTQEELARYVGQGLALLRSRGAERLVSACNTASASLALSLYDAFGMEPGSIIEMVGPTVSHFRESGKKIVLCATPATVRAGIYQTAFTLVGQHIAAVPIDGLAGAIEFAQGEEKQREAIEAAFEDIEWADVDTLVLACTHYPLALDVFRKIVPAHVEIFDPAVAVAERAIRQFWPQEVRDGKTTFVISQDSLPFRELVAKLFGDTHYTIEVL